jgi:Na+/H+ antiporter NhaC
MDMKQLYISLLLALFCVIPRASFSSASEPGPGDYEVEISDFTVQGMVTSGKVLLLNDSLSEEWGQGSVAAIINGERKFLDFKQGEADFEVIFDREEPFSIRIGNFAEVRDITPMPAWLSVLPPLIAIVLALVFKEVIISLFIGLLFGACCVGYYGGGLNGLAGGFFRIIDTYILGALNDSGHLSVILFSLFIGAIVALVSKNGGMQGVVNRLAKLARSPRSGQLTTWALGIAVFFDDYANSLVVGNTLRPVSDRLLISREKLAYIVDSTAAPIASVAFITTWIGAQLGYIDNGLQIINAETTQLEMGAYAVLVNSLAYSFYPLFTLVFIFMLVWMRRDFGPMLVAEKHARAGNPTKNAVDTGKNSEMNALQPADSTPQRPVNAVLPILVVVLGTVAGLLYTGWSDAIWNNPETGFFRKLAMTIGGSDSYSALLWSSMAGLSTALLLTLSQRLLTLDQCIEAVFNGFKTLLGAVAILILAWSLAAITDEMHSAGFLTGLITGNIPYWLIPALTFLLAALVAFSTGSSWGTMAILYPLMLPLSWSVCETGGCDFATAQGIFFHVVSAVLAGSVLGDHCSPISDTTILSSLATGTDHIAHVNTQLPYALTVGAVATLMSVLSGLININGMWLMVPGIALLYLIIRWKGKVV